MTILAPRIWKKIVAVKGTPSSVPTHTIHLPSPITTFLQIGAPVPPSALKRWSVPYSLPNSSRLWRSEPLPTPSLSPCTYLPAPLPPTSYTCIHTSVLLPYKTFLVDLQLGSLVKWSNSIPSSSRLPFSPGDYNCASTPFIQITVFWEDPWYLPKCHIQAATWDTLATASWDFTFHWPLSIPNPPG